MSLNYGVSNDTQLMGIDGTDLWIHGTSSWTECLCRSVLNDSSMIVAWNYFNNGSCQLFFDDNIIPNHFYMVSSTNSRLFIISTDLSDRLQSPCCGNLPWLLKKLKEIKYFRNVTVAEPRSLSLDVELMRLVLISGNDTLSIQQRDMDDNMQLRTTNTIENDSKIISYHRNFYYVGTNSSFLLHIYNSTLQHIQSVPFTSGNPQRLLWLYNSGLMCLILQEDQQSFLIMYNWYSGPYNAVWNRTVRIPVNKPHSLTKSNDDNVIYISGNTSAIYQYIISNDTWSLLVSNENSIEIPMALAIDSCGDRLWVLMDGFGLRIYHRLTGIELESWNLYNSYSTLRDMVLTTDFQLFLIDSSTNQLIHFGSSMSKRCSNSK